MTPQINTNDQSFDLWKKFILYLMHGPQFEFVADTTKNAILFFVIASVAIGLNLSVHYFESLKIDWLFIKGLQALEYLLFAADFLWFVVFLVITTYRTLKILIKNEI